jgi:hypothetical protein
MTLSREEIIRIACKAFQPRVLATPCIFPNCACKGPAETADAILARVDQGEACG